MRYTVIILEWDDELTDPTDTALAAAAGLDQLESVVSVLAFPIEDDDLAALGNIVRR